MISELEELAQGVAGPFMLVLSLLAIDESFSFYSKTSAGKCLPAHAPLELASACARIHMAVRARPSPCTRGSGVLAPTAVVEYWAGLRAREGLLMFSALPQQPWPPNSRSSHPPARADQTSRWPARR